MMDERIHNLMLYTFNCGYHTINTFIIAQFHTQLLNLKSRFCSSDQSKKHRYVGLTPVFETGIKTPLYSQLPIVYR